MNLNNSYHLVQKLEEGRGGEITVDLRNSSSQNYGWF